MNASQPKPRGFLLLQGGAEFGGKMASSDLRALELAGGYDQSVVIIPAAAAPDNNHQRAGSNGKRWFQSLGATRVSVSALISLEAGHRAPVVQEIRAARLIYLLGGFPHYLGTVLNGSPAWQAALDAYRAGAVIAGSSAGAMVLCETYFDPVEGGLQPGLNLLPNACVLPHHNTFGQEWAARLRSLLPEATLIGIDEQTGMINEGPENSWRVYGAGGVTLYRPDGAASYAAGEAFMFA